MVLSKLLKTKYFRRIVFLLAIVINILVIPLLVYTVVYTGKIYPNIVVGDLPVGKMKVEDATVFLSKNIKIPEKIKVVGQNLTFDVSPKDIDLEYDFSRTAERTYLLVRTGNVFYDIQKRIWLLFNKQNVGFEIKYNKEKLTKIISIISGQISIDPIEPSAKIVKGNVVVSSGRLGSSVDVNLLAARIGSSFSFIKNDDIDIPITKTGRELTEQELGDYKDRIQNIVGKTVEINFEEYLYIIKDTEIADIIDPRGGFKADRVSEIVTKTATSIDRQPQDPKFNFSGGRVTEFLPATDGVVVKREELKSEIEKALESLQKSEESVLKIEVPVVKTPPSISTDKVNDLGINELIGRGTSRFRGSIASRVHNVALAASRLNGILIKPGETLSFNDTLGDVSKFTGYQEAYIIRDGKTVLGDGGGVCQVSTTLFRAALNAGLPILERQGHAYRVGYYEQDSLPGLDATVYGPTPDLKIKNDTPAHILIQTKTDTSRSSLIFELYGTSDGRISTVSKPVVTDVVPAGEDIYIDDPNLPTGTIKQTEHRANGAKVTFNYTVKRAGETILKKTFTTNYKPWQAVYLRGTGPF